MIFPVEVVVALSIANLSAGLCVVRNGMRRLLVILPAKAVKGTETA
jgi:hypothetical protein